MGYPCPPQRHSDWSRGYKRCLCNQANRDVMEESNLLQMVSTIANSQPKNLISIGCLCRSLHSGAVGIVNISIHLAAPLVGMKLDGLPKSLDNVIPTGVAAINDACAAKPIATEWRNLTCYKRFLKLPIASPKILSALVAFTDPSTPARKELSIMAYTSPRLWSG